MKLKIAILFLLGIILTACAQLPAGDYVAFPGTPHTTPVVTAQQGGYTVYVFPQAPTMPGIGPVRTSTPYPTYTPWIVSATPALAATESLPEPTQEYWPTYPGELPIPTSRPTATPQTITPQPTPTTVCVAKNPFTSTTINVREVYAATGKFLFALPAGSFGIVGQIYEKSTGESWAYITYTPAGGAQQYGWVALKINGSPIAVLGGDCSKIKRGPVAAGGPFASKKVLVGAHFSWPTNVDTKSLAKVIQTAKCLPLTEGICAALKQNNSGVLTIYRDYRVEYPTDAELRGRYGEYATRVLSVLPAGFDYVEIMNEMPMTDEQYTFLAAFLVGVGQEMNKRGVCMLAPGFAPGNPDLNKHQWLALIPYMKWANNNPCGRWQDGTPKYHGISWHSAGYHPRPLPQWSWVNWSYVAGNAILANQQMNALEGFGIDDFLGPKMVTEVGLDDGYSGVWEQTSCQQNRESIAETTRVYSLYPELFSGFHWWNFGSPGKWGDLSSCLPGLFN